VSFRNGTHPDALEPRLSLAEVALAEGQIGGLLEGCHERFVSALRLADKLPDRELHREIGAVAVALFDLQAKLTGEGE